jgi:hypothetical protein
MGLARQYCYIHFNGILNWVCTGGRGAYTRAADGGQPTTLKYCCPLHVLTLCLVANIIKRSFFMLRNTRSKLTTFKIFIFRYFS